MRKTIHFLAFVLFLFACSSEENDSVASDNQNENPIDTENPEIPQSTVTDIDGNIYNTFIRNNRRWLKENLKTTRLNDGQVLSTSVTNSEWYANYLLPNYSVYPNNSQYNATYGKLYNLAAVKSGKLCPIGWHIPTFSEWNQSFNLSVQVMGDSNYATNDASGFKDVGSWPANPSNNATGFTALPSGYRDNTGEFIGIGRETYFWTSTVFSPLEGQSFETAWVFHIQDEYTLLKSYRKEPFLGLSCRCIEN